MTTLIDALRRFTAAARPKHQITVEKAAPLDLTRRHFVFGAAATLIVPPPKTFHILPPPTILPPESLILRPDKPFDLPLQQMLSLMKKLDEHQIELSAIPRWVVTDKDWYDRVVGRRT